MVNPKRITLARKRRGLSQAALAEALGVTPLTVNRWEQGNSEVPESTAGDIARELRFPVLFFDLPDPQEVDPDSVSFRALSKLAAFRREAAIGASTIATELADYLASQFNLPPPDVPIMRGVVDPEIGADSLRAQWGLGASPIRNVVHLLEGHGVRVFSLVEDCKAVDAFSFRRDDVPFVFLNTRKTAERSRFDACHELGHLVLHAHGQQGRSREAELVADRFASSFLMPRSSVLAHLPGILSIDSLIAVKHIWNVSLFAMIQRLRTLGVLTEWRHRSLCIEAAKRGYRSAEPDGGRWESSMLLNKVFKALGDEGVTRRDLAKRLHIPAGDLEALVFGLTMTRVE